MGFLKKYIQTVLFILFSVVLCLNSVHAEMRTWTSTSGKTFEGEFVVIMGDKVVIKTPKGKQIKVPLSKFSQQDRLFMELENPPEFEIEGGGKSSQHIWPQKKKTYGAGALPGALDYTFYAKIKQISSGVYNQELHVELIAVGTEIDGNNYIFLDRAEGTFIPSEYKNKTFRLETQRKVRLYNYVFYEDGKRGQKYNGYIITITDVRGEIIAFKSSYKWARQSLESIRTLHSGVHFDKTGTRVFPPRPRAGFQERNRRK